MMLKSWTYIIDFVREYLIKIKPTYIYIHMMNLWIYINLQLL